MNKISKVEAKWLLSAVSKDPTRSNLVRPYIVEVRGERYIAATCGHRLHMLRTTLPLGPIELSKDGTISGYMGEEYVFPTIEQVVPATFAHTGKCTTEAWLIIASARGEMVSVAFNPGEIDRPWLDVVVPGFWSIGPKGAETIGMNPKYVAEALGIAGDKKAGTPSFELSCSDPLSPLSPLMFRSCAEGSMWLAIVMPKRI